MKKFKFTQTIKKLNSTKSSYYYLEVGRETVEKLERKRATRLICEIDDKISFACGLNHLGGGGYFIILSKARITALGKQCGDGVVFEIYADPNPLGVDIPEVLQILLNDDHELQEAFNNLTDGKKRSLIFSTRKIKNVERQVHKIIDLLSNRPGNRN